MEHPATVRTYLLLAFGISWTVVAIGWLLGVHAATDPGYALVAMLCMLGPATAAVITHRTIERRPWGELGLAFKGIRWRGMLYTALLSVGIIPMTLAVSWFMGNVLGMTAFGDVSVTQERMVQRITEGLAASGAPAGPLTRMLSEVHLPGIAWMALFQVIVLIAECTVNAPFMLGEELGWRGKLYASWKDAPALRRVSLTGVIWGLWHAPLIAMGHNYPGRPVQGIALMVLFCTLLAVLFDRSRIRSASVWGPVLLHGSINGSAGIYGLFAIGGAPLVASPVGLAGFIALALLGLVALAIDRVEGRGTVPPGNGVDRPAHPASA